MFVWVSVFLHYETLNRERRLVVSRDGHIKLIYGPCFILKSSLCLHKTFVLTSQTMKTTKFEFFYSNKKKGSPPLKLPQKRTKIVFSQQKFNDHSENTIKILYIVCKFFTVFRVAGRVAHKRFTYVGTLVVCPFPSRKGQKVFGGIQEEF